MENKLLYSALKKLNITKYREDILKYNTQHSIAQYGSIALSFMDNNLWFLPYFEYLIKEELETKDNASFIFENIRIILITHILKKENIIT